MIVLDRSQSRVHVWRASLPLANSRHCQFHFAAPDPQLLRQSRVPTEPLEMLLERLGTTGRGVLRSAILGDEPGAIMQRLIRRELPSRYHADGLFADAK